MQYIDLLRDQSGVKEDTKNQKITRYSFAIHLNSGCIPLLADGACDFRLQIYIYIRL